MSTSIPSDFPSDSYRSSLAGAQPKIAMVEVDGKYYAEGNTPDQQLERYLMCEDLAQQGSVYSNRKIDEGVVADGSAALLRMYAGIKDKGWCTAEQYRWIGRRVATLNKWPIPDTFLDK